MRYIRIQKSSSQEWLMSSGDWNRALAKGLWRDAVMALLRIAIGWHLFYEGWAKLLHPGWTSVGYLQSATGPFAFFFHWLGAQAGLIQFVDQVNIWGLLLAGLGLMLGVLVRPAAIGSMLLLGLYYISNPPLFAPLTTGLNEGNYLVVNKNLVEFLALAAVLAYPAAVFGMASLFGRRAAATPAAPAEEAAAPPPPPRGLDQPLPAILGPMSRRGLFASLAGVPFVGGFALAFLKKHGWQSFEEVHLGRRGNGDTFVASATMKTFQFTSRSELKGQLPTGRIGNLDLSRMILGGNLIGGWAHARDLIYVSKLVRAYHHREKIFQTFALAESCGVNAIITNPLLCGVMNDYWRNGGRIHFISDCGGKNVMELIQKSIDQGAASCYIQGGVADRLVEEGKFDLMHKALELIRKNGLPAGIGGHKLQTIRASVEQGLRPDYWMKTLHKVDYWSAKPQPEHDNRWCECPDETAAYMKTLTEPWIAFKILAAGAIEPKMAFRHAFEAGADFICVGMYDFQIVDDVNLALSVLNGGVARARPWCA
jgi:uncharacterized membrane protein YphA (DoxX/SURF4 family)